MLGIHCRLPKFFRIHFAQTFKALNVKFVGFSFSFCFFFFCLLSFALLRTFGFNLLYLAHFRALADNFYFLFIGISISNLFSFFYFVEWWLGDINISRFNNWTEISIKKSQQKRADVRTVHIGIGRDNYLSIFP